MDGFRDLFPLQTSYAGVTPVSSSKRSQIDIFSRISPSSPSAWVSPLFGTKHGSAVVYVTIMLLSTASHHTTANCNLADPEPPQ